MTGFPSVDVQEHRRRRRLDRLGRRRRPAARRPAERRLDAGPGLLRRAAATEPTVTDCALVLGYIDPDYFLGGAMRLDADAARAALDARRRRAARPRRSTRRPPLCCALATEQMVGAIEEITVNQGIDPRAAVLVGGGGAAGLNAVAIARRLGCARRADPRGRRRAERRRRADVRPRRRATRRCCSRRSDRLRRGGGQRRPGRARASGAAPSSPGRATGRSSADRVLGRGALPAPDLGDRGAAAR